MKRHTGAAGRRRMKSLLGQYDMASDKMHIEPANEFIVDGRKATTWLESYPVMWWPLVFLLAFG